MLVIIKEGKGCLIEINIPLALYNLTFLKWTDESGHVVGNSDRHNHQITADFPQSSRSRWRRRDRAAAVSNTPPWTLADYDGGWDNVGNVGDENGRDVGVSWSRADNINWRQHDDESPGPEWRDGLTTSNGGFGRFGGSDDDFPAEKKYTSLKFGLLIIREEQIIKSIDIFV